MLNNNMKKMNNFSKSKKTGLIKSKRFMHNNHAQGLPMQTIVLVILAVIVIAAVLIFIFSANKTGTEQVQSQTEIGSSAADIANCRLWASGLNNDFDCSKTQCSADTLCKAYCAEDISTNKCIVPNDWEDYSSECEPCK